MRETAKKRILIPRFDTMGDLVLFSGVLDALLAEYPDAEITMMVLDRVKHVSEIFDPRIQWWPISPAVHAGAIDPLYSGELDYQALEPVIREVQRNDYDLLIGPLYTQTFLGSLIARTSGVRERIGFATVDPLHLAKVPRALRTSLSRRTYTRTVAASEWSHETEKNRLLLEAIVGRQCKLPRPSVHVRSPALEWADRFREETLGSRDRRFAVLFPGAGHVYRSWPLDRFVTIGEWLRESIQLAPLFAVGPHDKECLDAVRQLTFGAAAAAVPVVAFAPEELGRFAALLSRASLYLGNDTGPMHIAAALDIPTIGLFGGGTWGRFHPFGRVSAVVYHDMHCFQCGWHCVEGHYHCIRAIAERSVRSAVSSVLAPSGSWQAGKPLFVGDQLQGYVDPISVRRRPDRTPGTAASLIERTKNLVRRSFHAIAGRLP
jgi:ADP-heptose:LPS heptosyltransferase